MVPVGTTGVKSMLGEVDAAVERKDDVLVEGFCFFATLGRHSSVAFTRQPARRRQQSLWR